MAVLRGAKGLIRWGYFHAAALQGFQITRDAQGYALTGNCVLRDSFNLAQKPLTFTMAVQLGPPPHHPAEWTWPIDSLTLEPSGTLRARLGRRTDGAVSLRATPATYTPITQ
jgi:hypothetical protein